MKKSKLLIALIGVFATGAAFAGGTVRPAPEEVPAEVAPAPAPAPEVVAPAPAPTPVVVAPAFVPHAYVGASIGRTKYSGSALVGVDPVTGTAIFEAPGNATGGKVFAGYQWTPNWGAEIAYANLGSSGSIRGQGGVIDVTGTLPFAGGWGVFGKLGVADMKASGAVDDSYKAGGHYGIGVGYNWTQSLGVRAEAERFQKVGPDLSGNLYSVGLQYNF